MSQRISGRWWLGLSLALVAALMWGTLPSLMKGLVSEMDAYSITFYRFLGAALLLWLLSLRSKGVLKGFSPALNMKVSLLLGVALAGMCLNYSCFALSMRYQLPTVTQALMQVGPPAVFIGGAVIFKERTGWMQWVGICVLVGGLMLFFNMRLPSLLSSMGTQTVGALLACASALMWAMYALAQKGLLKLMGTMHVLRLLFTVGVMVFLPMSEPGSMLRMGGAGHLFLLLIVMNTVIGFACFATAFEHWEASRVGAVVALTPLISVGIAAMLSVIFPDHIAPERLNWLSVCGAALVVLGSMIGALGRPGKHVGAEAPPPIE